MANIYELTNDWQTVYQMIDDEEVPEDVLIDTLESIEGEIEYKADGYAMVIKTYNLILMVQIMKSRDYNKEKDYGKQY